jgi:hypothetical protein
MSEHTPDLDSLIDEHVLGPKRDDRFAHVHDVLVRAGPLPELPDMLARPPAVVVRRLSVGSPER